MSPAVLLQQWYDEVWNKGNEDFIDEMMHQDVIIHGLDPAGITKGIEYFKAFYKNFRKSFPTVDVNVKPLVNDGEVAAIFCHVYAKAQSGKDVFFTGLCAGRFKDGKLVEGWNNFDFLKMYQQLGHILVEQIEQ